MDFAIVCVIRMWTNVSEERITSIFKRNHLLRFGFLLGWFSTLKMEVIYSSETLVHIRNTRCCIPEDGNFYSCCLEFKKYIRISRPYAESQILCQNFLSSEGNTKATFGALDTLNSTYICHRLARRVQGVAVHLSQTDNMAAIPWIHFKSSLFSFQTYETQTMLTACSDIVRF
jgi:hypothetical protein